MPDWMPVQFVTEYNNTDLDYGFCVKIFAQLEALKREKFSQETARQFFIEFIRRGWTKKMLQKRYDALLGTKIYGIEKVEIADFINAVPVYAEDEVNRMIDQRIDSLIQRGRFLMNKEIELTPEENKMVKLAVTKELEMKFKNRRYEMIEEKKEELKKEYLSRLSDRKRKIAELELKDKMKITDELFQTGKIQGKAEGFLYQTTLHNLEDFADLIEDNWLN